MQDLKKKNTIFNNIFRKSLYDTEEIEILKNLEIEKSSGFTRILLISIITVFILQFVIFFLLDKETFISSKKDSLPYVFQNVWRITDTQNVRFFSARYPTPSKPLMIKSYPHLEQTEITIDKEKHLTFYQGNLQGHFNYKIWPVDVNGDEIDEIIGLKAYPYFAIKSSPHKADSLELVIEDYKGNYNKFWTFRRPDSAGPDDLWGFHVAPFNTPHFTAYSQTDSLFSLYAYGQGSNFNERYLMVFSKEKIPRLKARVKIPFYPSTGSFYKDNTGHDIFVFSGSSPSNGICCEIKEYLPDGRIREGKYWDDEGTFIQYDVTTNQVQWALKVGKGGGETRIFVPENYNQPLIGFFFREAFLDSPENKTSLYKISRDKGEILDSLTIKNDVRIFTCERGCDCGYIGLYQIGGNKYQLINKNGDLDRIISFNNSPTKKSVPVVNVGKGKFGFLINNVEANKCYLYDFSGNIIGFANGKLDYLPISAYYEEIEHEFLQIDFYNDFHLGYFKKNPFKLWIFIKYSRLLLFIILPQLLVIISYQFIKQAIERFNLRKALLRAYTMKSNEASSIGNMLSVTKIRAEEETEKRKTSDVKLQLSNRRLKTILNMIDEAVLTISNKMKVLHWNKQAIDILGFKNEDLHGFNIAFSKGKNFEKLRELVNYTFNNKEGINGLTLKLDLDSSKQITLKVNTTILNKNDNNNEVLIIFRDISANELTDKDISSHIYFDKIVGKSEKFTNLFVELEKITTEDNNILIVGEQGTGLTLFANAVYSVGLRAERPFIYLDCMGLPQHVLESYLFGFSKSTNFELINNKEGKLEEADGGILCLENINEIPEETWKKIFKLLKDGYYIRENGNDKIRVNIKIIGTIRINGSIKNEFMEYSTFREKGIDLKVVFLPPLRERKEDIPILITRFLDELNERLPESNKKNITNSATARLINYEWPGNVRQLKEVLITAFNRTSDNIIEVDNLYFENELILHEMKQAKKAMNKKKESIDYKQRTRIINLLKEHKGNKSVVAEKMNISRNWLYQLIRRYKIEEVEYLD